MKTIYRYTMLTALVLMITTQGCKKDFLDVNENPNNPQDVDMRFILPSAQSAVSYTLGNQLHVVGGLWAQYWTQGANASQYSEYDRYFWNNTDSDRPWLYLYAGALKDFDALYDKAIAENSPHYAGVTQIMQAYTLQIITDAWGDVPYTEALQGFEGNTTPKYDSQESIYNELIVLIDSGLAKLNTNSATGPGSDDLIYHGDITQWIRFANTLKLRIYLRQVYVRPGVSSEGIAALASNSAPFLEEGDDALAYYIEEQFRQNPLYTTVEALDFARNIFASATSIDTLLGLNDPRIDDFYEPSAGGAFVGIPQGAGKDPDQFPPPVEDDNFSEYDPQIIGPDVPVRLMTVSESLFLQAEAIARGYLGGDAQATYEAAIAASWAQWANASSAGDSVFNAYITQPAVAYPAGGSVEDQVKAIITQKWISMNGNQNFEAWTEWRRTGYPDFFVPSATAAGSDFPTRLTYSSDELTTNPNINKSLNTVFDRVWWDVL